MNIRSHICSAITNAASLREKSKYYGLSGGKLHRAMSQNFVRILAEKLRNQYPAEANVVVMSKDIDGNKLNFGMNELLFDITVFEWDTTSSIASKKKKLPFVKKGLLIVESEMEENSRAALHDFNKLVLGNAETKLFVGPLVANRKAYRETLAKAASHCSGSLHLVLVPHPRTWATPDVDAVEHWHWEQERWEHNI